MNKFIVVFLVMVLAGCSQSLDIQLDPEVSMFLSSDPEQPITLTEKDAAYVALSDWLHQHKDNWHATSGRYPGGVYIKTEKHGIQVTERNVVIYAISGSKPRAIYVQGIEKTELSALKEYEK